MTTTTPEKRNRWKYNCDAAHELLRWPHVVPALGRWTALDADDLYESSHFEADVADLLYFAGVLEAANPGRGRPGFDGWYTLPEGMTWEQASHAAKAVALTLPHLEADDTLMIR